MDTAHTFDFINLGRFIEQCVLFIMFIHFFRVIFNVVSIGLN